MKRIKYKRKISKAIYTVISNPQSTTGFIANKIKITCRTSYIASRTSYYHLDGVILIPGFVIIQFAQNSFSFRLIFGFISFIETISFYLGKQTEKYWINNRTRNDNSESETEDETPKIKMPNKNRYILCMIRTIRTRTHYYTPNMYFRWKEKSPKKIPF